MSRFEKVTTNLFRVRGRTHGYVLKQDSQALAIDPPLGDWPDHLGEIGVDRIDAVLATHHHRDTLAHAGLLVKRGAVLAAPAAEVDRIEAVDTFWKTARTFFLYDCDSDYFSLREPVTVKHALTDGEQITLAGMNIQALTLSGHTEGSMAYVVELDGKRLVFVGDNMSAPGQVHDLHDFQYKYMGFNEGTQALLEHLPALAGARADLLLPAHGDPIDDVAAAVALLEKNLQRHVAAVAPNRLPRPKNDMMQVGEHVFFVQGTTYCIITDEGKGLFWDIGYVEIEKLNRLVDAFGLKSVDVVTFSHYHDDHICRAHEFAERHHGLGTRHPRNVQLWCHETLHDILTHPLAWRMPCTFPSPLVIDRVYGDETIEWEGIQLEFFEFPGQTFYHAGMVAELDGRRYAFTGDNIWKRADEAKSITGPIIPRNRYFVDRGYEFSVQQLIDRRVDYICPAHSDAFPVTMDELQAFKDWAGETREAITALCPTAPLGMDPWWCRFYPFHLELKKNEVSFEVIIESPFQKARTIMIEPVACDPLSIEPSEAEVSVPARGKVRASFTLKSKSTLPLDTRIPVTARLTIDGELWGEIGEGLVVVRP